VALPAAILIGLTMGAVSFLASLLVRFELEAQGFLGFGGGGRSFQRAADFPLETLGVDPARPFGGV